MKSARGEGADGSGDHGSGDHSAGEPSAGEPSAGEHSAGEHSADAARPGGDRAEAASIHARRTLATALLVAMPGELGSLRERAERRRTVQGLEVFEVDEAGGLLVAVGGIGKVRAARAATILIGEARPSRLLVAGVCGGLRAHLTPGTLVHCERAIQTDLAVRDGRDLAADPALRAAWRAVLPGRQGPFLTADRPVLSRWRRLRLARAFAGDCVADMETAAAAAVAVAAGVPWAALRAVTDGAGAAALLSFRKHYPEQGGRAADSVPGLLRALHAGPDALPGPRAPR